jgi:uncharacterized membrane protein YjjP (DUF1212 family)
MPTANDNLLDNAANLALEIGRLLMESGARGRAVEDQVIKIARGLGADRVDVRLGYASLAITVGLGHEALTLMRKVGPHGVNQRLDIALRGLATRIENRELAAPAAKAELARLEKETPRHPLWIVVVAVGLACMAFGRLLGVDWLGTGPVFLAACFAQWLRREFAAHHINPFIGAALVAFSGSLLAGAGARGLASATVDTAMIAAVLLLVPGVPALNAQSDIIEGRPTLGSARAVGVAMVLLFSTAGVWLARACLGAGQ